MWSAGQALCKRLKEGVTNVTQPGNQWHGVGNESCDGRGRPHQLLSLRLLSEYSPHPGSCWDLRGALSAGTSGAPAHSWTMESPLGPFLEKVYRASDTSHHRLNQHVPLQAELGCCTSAELFSFLNMDLASRDKSKFPTRDKNWVKVDEEHFFLPFLFYASINNQQRSQLNVNYWYWLHSFFRQ